MNYIPIVLVGAIFTAIFRPSINGFEYTMGPHVAYEIQSHSDVQTGARRTALAASLSAITEPYVEFGVSWSQKGYTGCSEHYTGGETDLLDAYGRLLPFVGDPPCKVGENFDRTYTSVDLHGLWRPTRRFGDGPASAYLAVGAFAGIGVRCRDVKPSLDESARRCPAGDAVGGVLVGTGVGLSLSERIDMTFGLRYRRETFGRGEMRHYHTGSLLGGVVYRLAR